jgi:peptidoglycan-associated lipoprotein
MKRRVQMFMMFFLAVTMITFGNACAKKQVKQEAPVIDTSAADEARKRAEEEAAAAAKKRAEEEAAAASKRAEDEAAAARQRAEADAAQRLLQDQMNAFESEKIYFDYDRADLKPEAQATLEKKARLLESNPSYSVTIEGHCDERGTNEYNLALGERRADAAKKYLGSLGISGDRITTISYGEEKPVAAGHNESSWSQNRRDEFKLAK